MSAVKVAKKFDESRKEAEKNEATAKEAKQLRQKRGLDWDDLTQEERLEESDRKWPWNRTVMFRYSHIYLLIAGMCFGIIGLTVAQEREPLAIFVSIIGVILLLFALEAFLFNAGFGRK
jgi:hypothetical protein